MLSILLLDPCVRVDSVSKGRQSDRDTLSVPEILSGFDLDRVRR